MNTENTLLNAVIGAVATVVLSFIPFSPVLGGAIAGYLEGVDTGDGLRVGAISGAIASLPAVGLLLLFLVFVPFAPDLGIAVGGLVLLSVVIAIAIGYFAALSALGGILGAFIRAESEPSSTPDDRV
ncbi:DUF5518 domain-containing protein [Halorubrum sp. DTA98]|uniref:DUF5518 domain-containing protein n=1 Tax=Halorubrum sp. DTA98 TaxID=3402163 RepID=UPI003AAE28DC